MRNSGVSKRNAVKLSDVAEKAGVSVMTVSLALRGEVGGSRISPETQQRVLKAAQELRYMPNARARALRTGVTNVIGLYAGHGYVNVRLPFFTEIVSGLQEGCEQVKKDLLLHGIFHGTSPDDIYNELADGRIDGLVVTMPPDDQLARRLADSHLPVVAIADSLPNIPSVVTDDAAGSRLIAEHLFQRGHRKVVYITSSAHPVSAIRRHTAFMTAAAERGMEVEESLLHSEDGAEGRFIRQVLAREASDRPTAVVCWNDQTALYLASACQHIGVRVPEDIAVVGFDGCPSPYETFWSLTTVRAPWAEVARTAVHYLDAILKGETVPIETVLPVELRPGNTT